MLKLKYMIYKSVKYVNIHYYNHVLIVKSKI